MSAPTVKEDDSFGEQETARRYQATLKSVLAMPPQPKTKAPASANPKKRGRPPRQKEDG